LNTHQRVLAVSDKGVQEGEEGEAEKGRVGMHEREPRVNEGGTTRELGSRGVCSLVPRPIFRQYNGATGEKYGLVLIVYGRVGCDRKFNSKTCRKTIVHFNENTDK